MRTLTAVTLIVFTLVSSSGKADSRTPPERDDPNARLSTDELQKLLSRRSRNMAVVGLKPPSEPRGIWKERVLTTLSVAEDAITLITNIPGIKLVRRSKNILPYVIVEVIGTEALQKLRNIPHVDYIEPLFAELSLEDSSACSWGDPWTDSVETMPGEQDIVPWVFFEHNIPDAWDRAGGGRDMTVATIDTGISVHQTQLRSNFATGKSVDRAFLHAHTDPTNNGDDVCGHGTRMSGILAAPRDDRSIVGIAWEANLVTIKAMNSVWAASPSEITNVADGIVMAANNGARILTLALGVVSPASSQVVTDAIFTTRATHDVIIIAAAGTIACRIDYVPGAFQVISDDGVIFPAILSDADGEPLLAVTGVDANGNRESFVCGGPQVDLTARIGAPTTGQNESKVVSLAGSSQATALVAGVAALVWSQSPTMSASEIKKVLLSSGERSTRDAVTGFGRIDAAEAASKVFPAAAFPVVF